jgi:hypothetical protein
MTQAEREFWRLLREKEHQGRARDLRAAKRGVRSISDSLADDRLKHDPAVTSIADASRALQRSGPALENLAANECGDKLALDAGFIRDRECPSDPVPTPDPKSDLSNVTADAWWTPATAERMTGVQRADLLAAARRGEIRCKATLDTLFYFSGDVAEWAMAEMAITKEEGR